MTAFAAAWTDLTTALGGVCPAAVANLAPPATPERVRELEAVIGRPLPDDHRQLLLAHDGFVEYDRPLVNYEHLCPVEQAIKLHRMRLHQLGSGEFGRATFAPPDAGRRKADTHWRPGWVPLTQFETNGFVTDLDPGPKGTVGQVFYFDTTGDHGPVVADSVTNWVRVYAAHLRSGRYTLDDGRVVVTFAGV